jgi:hypothetical protein
MSRVKHSAPSDPPALPKSEDTLDSASPLTSNTVARAAAFCVRSSQTR